MVLGKFWFHSLKKRNFRLVREESGRVFSTSFIFIPGGGKIFIPSSPVEKPCKTVIFVEGKKPFSLPERMNSARGKSREKFLKKKEREEEKKATGSSGNEAGIKKSSFEEPVSHGVSFLPFPKSFSRIFSTQEPIFIKNDFRGVMALFGQCSWQQ